MEKTLGELSDELSITNISIWMAENVKRSKTATDKEIADATRFTNEKNTYRNKLMDAINKTQGIKTTKGDKTYK